MIKFSHVPVMLKEAISSLNIRSGGRFLDCTFGNGGYTQNILNTIKDSTVVAVDRDPLAYKRALDLAKRYPHRLFPVHCKFSEFATRNESRELFDGIVMDLGVSSMQIDDPERGFSYKKDGPLDMTMDQQKATVNAFQIVNFFPPDKIAEILQKYGDEHFAKKIADQIDKQRQIEPLTRTKDLVHAVYTAIPKKYLNKSTIQHPAMRTFQALRIFCNDEMNELKLFLGQTLNMLRPDGRLVVVSYHSTEDRIVKQFLKTNSDKFEYVKKPLFPKPEEIAENQRARSARMRIGTFRNV